MKNLQQDRKELILEVQKDGYRRLIHRIAKTDGSTLLMEETDLIDLSRPIREGGDFNVYFSKNDLWEAFTRFTSSEGLLRRQVWHESQREWLSLTPMFIHPDMRPLVQQSLTEATRELDAENPAQLEGIHTWLRKLAQPSAVIRDPYFSAGREVMNTAKAYLHAV